MTARLAVCACDAAARAVLAELLAAGWTPYDADGGRDADGRQVWAPEVVAPSDLPTVTDLLLRGVTVVARADAEATAVQLYDQGRRLAPAEWYDEDHPPVTLGLEAAQVELLLRISRGEDVRTAARGCNLSARTAARRLAAAREVLGSATTAEAALRVRARIDELRAAG